MKNIPWDLDDWAATWTSDTWTFDTCPSDTWTSDTCPDIECSKPSGCQDTCNKDAVKRDMLLGGSKPASAVILTCAVFLPFALLGAYFIDLTIRFSKAECDQGLSRVWYADAVFNLLLSLSALLGISAIYLEGRSGAFLAYFSVVSMMGGLVGFLFCLSAAAVYLWALNATCEQQPNLIHESETLVIALLVFSGSGFLLTQAGGKRTVLRQFGVQYDHQRLG